MSNSALQANVMPRLQRKNFTNPDEIRCFDNGKMDIVNLDETAVAYFILEPGWEWVRDVSPVANTASCHHRHLGYTISGYLMVRMDDGSEILIGPGDAYEIPPGHTGWVHGDQPWEAVEFTSGHSFARGSEDLGERVLATILFSDIVDSTPKLQELGDQAWSALLRQHNARVRAEIDRHRGREMANLGDGFLALFDGAARAVQAAAALDRAIADLGLRVRVGLHTGEVSIEGGQVRGIAVHAAARVSALAGAGEVLMCRTTHDMLDGTGFQLEPRGEVELKGIAGKRAIFALGAKPQRP